MWTLLLSRQGDPPGTFLDRRQIDSGQIKVGRSATTCDLVVPDTSGQLSREHCLISAIGLDLFVVDTSTNGVALNQPTQRIAPQQPVAVRVGDRLLLGDFVIEVATESGGLGAQLHTPSVVPPAESGFQQADAWFDGSASAIDPIWGTDASRQDVHDFLGDAMHDFLAPPTSASAGGAATFDPFGGAFGEAFSKPLLAQPIEAVPEAFAIPEDWAAPVRHEGAGAASAALAPTSSADPFANSFAQGTIAQPADDPFADFKPSPAANDDPFAAFEMPFSPDRDVSSVSPGELSESIDALLPVGSAPAPHRGSEAGAAAPVPAAAADYSTSADWAAFAEGAGIDPDSFRGSPQAMRKLGVLYRQVVLGVSDLIQDRAAFKDEFRVERTQLSFGRNNPLKHLAPLESAKLLLNDPLPGFMDAEEAIHSGLEDVKRHQLALLAGVQHALKAVFERLSPGEVERVMKTATVKRGFLGRGVDPWSVYRTMWEALRTDAASNVNSVMSVAFREGYEAFLKTGKGAG